ncbi:heavy metal translocating P-type ATPase [Anaerococcus marasmi]|uniref:heavy metal translocating P-type ATPase n=1 Tax=Anaerococcus marasmi TaxID=2057797 RepID=UPI000CF85254|nr:heavy metal translocating P-type ATPase [Anaerococcus marasmi]
MFESMTDAHKKELSKLIAIGIFTAILAVLSNTIGENIWIVGGFLLAYLLSAWNVLIKGFKGIIRGQAMDENFLLSIASIAAFLLGQYIEAIAVILFYNFGDLFENIASHKSRQNIEGLLDLVPDVANKVNPDGSTTEIDLDDVEVGDILLVRDGEKIGVDGVVIEGHGLLDTSSVTGESMPVEAEVGSEVISSSLLTEGIIKIRAQKEFDDSVAAKIMEIIEDSAESKSQSEKMVTRFAKIYTPIVVAIALIVAIIPPLFFGVDWYDSIFLAATFLVISCPCGLVLSVPLSFMSGLGLASENGILIKGSQYFEGLKNAKVLLSDKTGTLTTGNFKVKDIEYFTDHDREKILDYIYNIELMSTHPIAKGIVKSLDRDEKHDLFEEVTNEKGLGVRATSKDGDLIKIGSARFIGYDGEENDRAIYVSIDDKLAAKVIIEDEIKDQSFETIEDLRKHFENIAVVSGDGKNAVEETAKELGLDDYYAEVMPDQKLEIMKGYQDKGLPTVFVGDGINDAPVLTNADVGISMGETASDLAIESSDILVVNGEFREMSKLMKISDLTNRTVRQNVTFIMAVKIGILIAGLLGYANMWLAIFGDVGVTIIAVLWAMRILKKKI